MKKRILWLTVDIMAAAFVLVIVWVADYKIPQKGVKAVSIENAVSEAEKSQNEMPDFNQKIQMGDTKEGTASLQKTCIVRDSQDWHKKYVDKFSDTVVATDTSKKMAAWSGNFTVHDVIQNNRGERAACKQLLVSGVPFDKLAFHTKGDQFCQKEKP